MPDEVAGERVKVIIVPRNPGLTKESVLEHCRKNLTGYKIPRIVEFRDTELLKPTWAKFCAANCATARCAPGPGPGAFPDKPAGSTVRAFYFHQLANNMTAPRDYHLSTA